jgi:hypothetical protein
MIGEAPAQVMADKYSDKQATIVGAVAITTIVAGTLLINRLLGILPDTLLISMWILAAQLIDRPADRYEIPKEWSGAQKERVR